MGDTLSRRSFTLSASATAAILALAGCDPDPVPKGEEGQEPQPEAALSSSQQKTLSAMCDRLLPAHGDLPAASALGVPGFIASELEKPLFSEVRDFVGRGLTLLDGNARSLMAKHFHDLDVVIQDQMLQELNEGVAPGPEFAQHRFFELVLTFALEGYFGHPKYGGNKDRRAWKALGITWHG